MGDTTTTKEITELDIKQAIQIAKIVATAPEERLPLIMDIFSKAGVDIEGLDEMLTEAGLDHQARLIDTGEFVLNIVDKAVARGDIIPADDEFRIPADKFNAICKESNIRPRLARKLLAEGGYIRTWESPTKKTEYTISVWDAKENTSKRCVRIYAGKKKEQK